LGEGGGGGRQEKNQMCKFHLRISLLLRSLSVLVAALLRGLHFTTGQG
jgi:hypothetical protein